MASGGGKRWIILLTVFCFLRDTGCSLFLLDKDDLMPYSGHYFSRIIFDEIFSLKLGVSFGNLITFLEEGFSFKNQKKKMKRVFAR